MLRLFVTFCLVWATSGQDTITFGPYNYSIHHMPFELSAAETASAKMSATLAVINNERLYRKLVDFIEVLPNSLHAYWIGLRRIPDTNDFVWDDGTRLQNGDFAPWSEAEPDNIDRTKNCVAMGHPCCDYRITGYKWFVIQCPVAANIVGFICQRLSTPITSVPNLSLSFSSALTVSSTTPSRLSSTTAEALSPAAAATITVLGCFVAIAACIVAIVLTRRKSNQRNKSQYSLPDNNPAPPRSAPHAIYEVIKPPNADVADDEENAYIEANVNLKPAAPVDENGYSRIDELLPNTIKKADQIQENKDGYLKVNVPNPLLDDHGYASVSERHIGSGTEYVNFVSKDAEYINAKSKEAKHEDVVSKTVEYINTKPRDMEYANTNSKDAVNADTEAKGEKKVGSETNII